MNDIIVYLGSNIPDKSPAGIRVFANALALRDYGYNVKIISQDVDYRNEIGINEGIETWHLRYPKTVSEWFSSLIDVKSYAKIIDRIGDVKVVIAYGHPSIAFLRLRRYCKRKGIKLVCETTEWMKWENLAHLGFIARFVRVLDIELSIRYAYNKCDAIIVSSHYFADCFKGNLPVLSLPTLQCYRLDIDKNHVISHPRKFIYAGGIGYKKDMLSEIIHAFGKISSRDFLFNILGLTKQQYAEQFEADIPLIDKINQGKEKIVFWGSVQHCAVLKELTNSDFSLIIRQNSRRNNVGFPTKFGESINCGTPVIVSDFSDVVYYTNLYNIGIITKVDNIEKGLIKALDMNNDELQQMRQRCKECDTFYYKGNVEVIGNFISFLVNDDSN